jgi:uncharacterized protein with GYD domain
MGKYFMFGSYSDEAVGEISAARTDEAAGVIETNGGSIKAAYALLGDYDVVIIAKFPGNKAAMKASVELSRLLGIGFTTAPAISIDAFDELVGV